MQIVLFKRFVVLDDVIEARCILFDALKVKKIVQLSRTCQILGFKLHRPLVFGSYEVLQTRLRQIIEPPHDKFKARAELLNFK